MRYLLIFLFSLQSYGSELLPPPSNISSSFNQKEHPKPNDSAKVVSLNLKNHQTPFFGLNLLNNYQEAHQKTFFMIGLSDNFKKNNNALLEIAGGLRLDSFKIGLGVGQNWSLAGDETYHGTGFLIKIIYSVKRFYLEFNNNNYFQYTKNRGVFIDPKCYVGLGFNL